MGGGLQYHRYSARGGVLFLGRYRACAGGWCSVDVCQYVVVAINAQLLRRLDLSR